MLQVSELTTHYGSSQALFGMNLDIEAGQVITLLGRNGMGKTTTINTIMGIVPGHQVQSNLRAMSCLANRLTKLRISDWGWFPRGGRYFQTSHCGKIWSRLRQTIWARKILGQ